MFTIHGYLMLRILWICRESFQRGSFLIYSMAASMIALCDSKESYRWLSEAASAQGLFGETWEINEPGLRIHPWFTTASGVCAYALAQMLVAEIDGVLHIAPGVPDNWKDYAFSLPSSSGVWVDCEVRGGQLAYLSFRPLRKLGASENIAYVFRNEEKRFLK